MRVKSTVWSLAALLLASPLAAQPVSPSSDVSSPRLVSLGTSEQPPAYVAVVEGAATLIRAGESTTLDLNTPVIEGDRLRVDSGFVELRWDDGAALFLDSRTTLDIVAENRLRLADGQVRFVAGRRGDSTRWTIDTPAAEVRLEGASDVLLVTDGTGANQPLDAYALLGSLDVANDRGTFSASQGESVHAEAFRAPTSGRSRVPTGGLMAWSQTRLQQDATALDAAPTSNGIVEYDDYGYDSTLVRYGTWDRDSEYGAVWYPTAGADWRPYYNGRWERTGRYGYVWVGADPWSYRTHHYGRWGHRGGRWFWIPGRTWASAWVSWAVGPGYVSWSPLGYDNRPVFSFSLSYGDGGYRRGYRDNRDGWRGWTVVPSDRWRRGGRVDRFAVNPRELPDNVRGSFVTQSVAPYRSGSLSRMGRESYAVPRGSSGGSGDTRDVLRRGVGPTRVERDGPRGYVPVSPRRVEESVTSPYERARRVRDRNVVPQGAPVPQGESPRGSGAAIRRPSPASEPPAERPSYTDRNMSRLRTTDGGAQGTRRDDRPERAPRVDDRGTPQYTRPAPQAPRSGDEGGARARSRDREAPLPSEGAVSSPDSGRRSNSSSGERSRPNRVPPPRQPRG